ncbi:unnamed protein product, partial [Discosporangium mesarthrocarpum]
NRTEPVCYILQEWWFYGPANVMLSLLLSRLFIELSRVHDRINMAKEVIACAAIWIPTAVGFYIAKIFHDSGFFVLPRWSSFCVSIMMGTSNFITFFIEPRRHHGVVNLCGQNKKKKVVIDVDQPHIMKWKQQWPNSRVIMEDVAMDPAFEKHVQDFLCSESYDFLKQVDRYVEKTPSWEIDQQFKLFREIVDAYIVAGSELEVNIETAMRNRILKVSQKRREKRERH